MQKLSDIWVRKVIYVCSGSLLVFLSIVFAIGLNVKNGDGQQAFAAAQYWEYDGLKTNTAPKSQPAFAELEMQEPDYKGTLPMHLARETAFAYLYQDKSGLGSEGHYYGNWDQAGVGLEIHLKGNIRGVFLMYNRTPW